EDRQDLDRPDDVAEGAAAVESERVLLVVVGIPVSLNGSHGEQTVETAHFVKELQKQLKVPVKTWDERFTSKIAREKGMGAAASEHSIAACCLLEDFLTSEANRQGTPGN
ncbi:MAG: Holliday junction resolvase RuvX, partial [Actinomycetota bacterium]